MRKFLALPIDKKTTHAARMMAKIKKELVGELEEEEEEEREKMKNLKQKKAKPTFPKQTPGRHELKIAMMKRGGNLLSFVKIPDATHSLWNGIPLPLQR